MSDGYLLDTNIVSIFSPTQRGIAANRPAIQRLSALDAETFLSVLTLLEIESGIRQLVRSGSTQKAPQLEVWLEEIIDDFADSLLLVDERVARTAGQLDAISIARGRHPGLADLLIAATAIVGNLVVVTRNTRHFAMFDVATLDPFQLPETDA